MNFEKKNEINNNTNTKKTEEYLKSKSSKIFTKEMLVMFNDEDEKKNSNIVYSEPESKKKIKYISLDLLLKKIVIDDFLEKNQFLIYYFCQQCFCFIDSEILFHKIINCYQYYRSKGVPSAYLSNIITFFNILVIEMYDYYKEIRKDDASLIYINNFYEIVIKEYNEFSSKKKSEGNTNNLKTSPKRNYFKSKTDRYEIDKIELTKSYTNISSSPKNNNIFFHKISKEENNYLNNIYSINTEINNINNSENEKSFNNKIDDNIDEAVVINEYFNDNNENNLSINNNDNQKLKENIEIVENNKKENENESLKIKNEMDKEKKLPNDNNINCTQKQNVIFEKIEEEEKLKWSNTEKKNINIKWEEKKEEINKEVKPKKRLSNFFDIFKKPKEKIETKSCDTKRTHIRNINLKNSIKAKKYKTSDEEILENIKNIKNYLLMQKPSTKIIENLKNSLIFYRYINSKNITQKNSKELSTNKKLRKSRTEDNIFKKKKKAYESKDYFDVQDWDDKEIGNKLLLISESLINKVQRKELYKAIYLKKDKKKKSPNIMRSIENFNNLSFFIILDIISYDNPKDRAKMIDKWTKIAMYCKSVNNFNDLFAIYSALNNYNIQGLNLTLKEVKNKTIISLRDINKFCDCQGNYKKVRDYIAGLKQDEFYLPYLGILLRDLAFHEEKSKYIINGVLINLEKIETIQKIIDNFFKFRYIPKKQIEKTPNKLNFFEHLESIQEDNLEYIANNIEPFFNFPEKKIKRHTYIDKRYFLHILKDE